VWAAALFALLALVTLTDAQLQSSPGTAPGQSVVTGKEVPWRPWVIAASPQPGESEVDPALAEFTVTFDRDMSPGMSWTGRDGEYPPTPEGRPSYWRDRRTCVLPVKLEAGHYYRLDINAYNQAFRGADGRAAAQSVLYFTTQGASQAVKAKLTKPKVVSLIPPNGTTDVDPNLKEIRVTFDLPMTSGYSWTGAGDQYPGSPGNNAHWIDDYTCVLPVALKPDHPYTLGVNSVAAVNFQSAGGGVPCDPVEYTFRTRP
jgi:RNA polymerase sigma-70 factor (ECF subfamily)